MVYISKLKARLQLAREREKQPREKNTEYGSRRVLEGTRYYWKAVQAVTLDRLALVPTSLRIHAEPILDSKTSKNALRGSIWAFAGTLGPLLRRPFWRARGVRGDGVALRTDRSKFLPPPALSTAYVL